MRDPFQHSLLGRPAAQRVAGAALILAALWTAIFWAARLQ